MLARQPSVSAPAGGETSTVRVPARGGPHQVAEGPALVPVPPALPGHLASIAQLAGTVLELPASPGAVPRARHYARQVVWDTGLKELTEQVELVVSEIVTNAVQASAAPGTGGRAAVDGEPVVRLWLAAGDHGVLVLVWDASCCGPQRQSPAPDSESGRGLLLVETMSSSWGSFELGDQPGKVVWALCQLSGGDDHAR
jgi:anti-sigma regulatory factor (Ser/Thr protein kinase)